MTAPSTPGRLGILAFVSPSLALAALGPPLVLYLPEFFANYVGLPLGAVGAAFMWVRLVDIGFDPLLGAVMDRTRTRLGQFRAWLLIGVPPMLVGCAMLYLARPGVSMGYLVVGLVFIYAAQSICHLAQNAWASRLTESYDGRSRIYAWNQAAGVMGMLVILALPPLVAAFHPGDRGAGMHVIGWYAIVLMSVTTVLAVAVVPEPLVVLAVGQRAPLRAILRSFLTLARRPSVARILIVDLLLGLNLGLTGAVFLFYAREVLKLERAQANVALLIFFSAGLLGIGLWMLLARRFGKHLALAGSSAWIAACQALLIFAPAGNALITVPGFALVGLSYPVGAFLLRAMMADAADEVSLDLGHDHTALLYALVNATSKVGQALAVGIAFNLLAAIGFVATEGTTNSSGAVLGLTLIFIGGSILLTLAATAVAFGYKLTKQRHDEIVALLASVRPGN
jgi:Na+/melibiose symporter-like transporter